MEEKEELSEEEAEVRCFQMAKVCPLEKRFRTCPDVCSTRSRFWWTQSDPIQRCA